MLFTTALFVSCLVTLLLARYAWVRREVPAARSVAVMSIGISWWTLCYALQLLYYQVPGLIPQPEALPLFWFRLMFVGVGLLPAAFLVFVVQYTGMRDRVSPRTVLLLSVVPTLVVIAALTDGIFHDWFLAGFRPGDGQRFTGGPVFAFHVLYSYGLTLVAYGLLIRFIIRSPAYRKQAVLLLLGGLASSVANLLTIFNILPEQRASESDVFGRPGGDPGARPGPRDPVQDG